MKHLLHALLVVGSSRLVPPVVIGIFFILYVGIAFFTDETLITLMAFTRKSMILAAILALIPLNSALRLVRETAGFLRMRRAMAGKTEEGVAEMFDEVVEISGPATVPDLERRFAAVGYSTCRSENVFAAWKGISSFPVRILFLAGTFCLFAGILVTTTSRDSLRQMIVEGEPLPAANGSGGMVERITLANADGFILSKALTMEVAPTGPAYGKRVFGLYPPSLYNGAFVYPRYIGLAVYIQFSAPDLPAGYEAPSFLGIYPPGKEENVLIPGSPYRIVFSIPEPEKGSDMYVSYIAGATSFQFKLLKGNELLFAGTVPGGGAVDREGFRLALPDVRRLVVADFVRDYGVFFVWAAGLLLFTAITLWIPIRLFFPRREILLRFDEGVAVACSSAEGGSRKHSGVFHEMLDMIDAKRDEPVI